MREPIRSLVISLPAPEAQVERLRRAFPEIAITRADADELVDALAEADAVAAWRIPEEAIAKASRLKWIHRGAAGVEDLVTPTLAETDIILTNSSGVHAPNIAEHVMACMLAFARRLPKLLALQKEHAWNGKRVIGIFELTGQTVLLAGLGDIGQAVATRAQAFDMHTIGIRRRPALPRPDAVETMMPMDRFHEALGSAHHVVNSLPLTANTAGLFDAAAFTAMRPGTFFYNVGRGGTVDQDALVAALRSGRLGGAALDVTSPEPLPEDSPLWDMDNVIITQHTAGRTPNTWDRVFRLIETNLERYQAGDALLNVVDIEEGY
jgi:phosphoglycerate dehydrogenase-like enzyme